ncbi:MAG TPA: pyridoxamine 5'-phosphate oxidase family protein [Candidatus Limnocylindrales bacterium]|nr:pyridoxamine 5'-phosphate oxidase family protein [Candidatus Limnocylindrales bacterium]
MEERVENYLATHHAAAMITLRADGSPHAVRCGIALVDGKLWSSGVPQRVRNRHLRRDPRATLFVFGNEEGDKFSYLTLEGTVRILDGPDAAEFNRRLFTVMQASLEKPPDTLFWERTLRTVDEFLQIMTDERRLIYEFEITRSHGMF